MMEIHPEIMALIGAVGITVLGGMFAMLRSDIKAIRTEQNEQGLAIARLEATVKPCEVKK